MKIFCAIRRPDCRARSRDRAARLRFGLVTESGFGADGNRDDSLEFPDDRPFLPFCDRDWPFDRDRPPAPLPFDDLPAGR